MTWLVSDRTGTSRPDYGILGHPRIMGPAPNTGPAFMLFPTQARGELAVKGELSDRVYCLLPPGNGQRHKYRASRIRD